MSAKRAGRITLGPFLLQKPGPSRNQTNRTWRLFRSDACEDSLEYAGMTSWQMHQWWTRLNTEASAAESSTDVCRYLGVYVVCKNRFLRMKHFIWQSTPVQVSDPMTGRTGSVREVVLDISGMIRQLEVDVGLTVDAAWDMASDRQVWRSSGPVSECKGMRCGLSSVLWGRRQVWNLLLARRWNREDGHRFNESTLNSNAQDPIDVCIAFHRNQPQSYGASPAICDHTVTCHPTQVNAPRLNPNQTGR